MNAYYPFGMNHGANVNGAAGAYKYQYNGKELNEDLGLNWNDYGARFYDPALGRWNGVDKLSEKLQNYSPYIYALDRPVNMKDVDGNYAVSVHYYLTYDMLREAGYSKKEADLIAHYASVYADHPPALGIALNQLGRPQDKADASQYRKGIDYTPTNDSQKEECSDQHSMMSNEEAANGMTREQAKARGISLGWNFIFGSDKGKNLGKLGQGIHALQDAAAHQGMKTNDHLGKNESSAKQLWKDMYGDKSEAQMLTKSAIAVSMVLDGKAQELENNTYIDTSGMTQAQVKQLESMINAQGMTVTEVPVKK